MVKFSEVINMIGNGVAVGAPLLGGAIKIANAFFPPDAQISPSAGQEELLTKVNSLPPAKRGMLLDKELDLAVKREEGWTERYSAMCAADGQETRAKIVRQLTNVLCFEILAFTVGVVWKPEIMSDPNTWMVFGVLTGTPATVLLNYFGNLRQEQTNRQASVSGVSPSGAIVSLIKHFKG